MIMREQLSEARERVHRAVRQSPRVVAVVAVVLLLLTAGVAAQAALVGQWSNDFEDGTAEEWTQDAPTFEVVNTGYDGGQSLYVATSSPGFSEWRGGPVLDINQEFEISGTFRHNRVSGTATDRPTRIGVRSASGDVGVILMFNSETGETYLSTDPEATQSDTSISDAFNNEWVRFELSSEADSSTVTAKVWVAGTAEPTSPQISKELEQGSGVVFVDAGGDDNNVRELWLDEISVTGTQPSDPDLSLETRQLFQPGATHEYAVRETRNVSGSNRSYDVTDNATVESLNTSLLTVNDNNTLTATDDPNASATVFVRAQYNNSTTYQEVVVAEPTVENLQIVPGIWRFFAVFDDATMFTLLIAALLSVPAARFTSAFGGLAVSEMVIVIGWVTGRVAFGFAAVSVFVALFIGLNLAANIDYQVRK